MDAPIQDGQDDKMYYHPETADEGIGDKPDRDGMTHEFIQQQHQVFPCYHHVQLTGAGEPISKSVRHFPKTKGLRRRSK